MNRVLVGLAAACLLGATGLLSLVTGTDDATALTNCDTNSASLDSAELEMLQLVNDARAANGAAPLVVSPNLNRAAAWKSEDAGSNGTYGFDHTDSLGRSPYKRAQECGYPTGAAENIAYGYPGASGTFGAFMGSSGHRANILNPTYVAIGIGRSSSAWTLNFGFVDDSDAPPPTPTPTQAPAQVAHSTPASTATQPQPSPTATTPAPPPTPTPTPVRHGVTLTLGSGLNLVGYSAPSSQVQAATASLGNDLVGVYWWDAEAKTWLHYFPGVPAYANTLDVLHPGFAYYITVANSAVWAY